MTRAATRLTLVAVTIMVALVAAGTTSFARPADPSPTPSPSQAPPPSSTGRFDTDGGVAMSIAGVNCGHRAQAGEYCYVTFRAVNVSDGFPVFTEADQVAYDTAGRAFHPDAAAGAAVNAGKPITQRLLRGPVVSGVLVYALPAGDQIARVVLHGKTGTPGEVFQVN